MSLGYPDRYCLWHGDKLYIADEYMLFDEDTGEPDMHIVYYKCPRWFCTMNCRANGEKYFAVKQ